MDSLISKITEFVEHARQHVRGVIFDSHDIPALREYATVEQDGFRFDYHLANFPEFDVPGYVCLTAHIRSGEDFEPHQKLCSYANERLRVGLGIKIGAGAGRDRDGRCYTSLSIQGIRDDIDTVLTQFDLITRNECGVAG